MLEHPIRGAQLMSIYQTREHYVYMYLRESNGTPYYVGKGKGDRYKEKHRVNIPPKEENIVFVAKDLTNEEACNLEKLLISQYGRKDLGEGILHNQTDGGDSGDTSKSESYQIWLHTVARNPDSDYVKMLSHKMKTSNPMFNPEIAIKSQTLEARKKRGESQRGKVISEDTRKRLSEIGLNESKERSYRMKETWKDNNFRERFSNGAKRAIVEVKDFTEHQFYEWIKGKKLFTSDGKSGNIRPNSRVKLVIEHFGKMEEFYGDYYRDKERNKKKPWYYYKNCPDEEFLQWIGTQSLFRKDGQPNPRIVSVIKHRGLIEYYYGNLSPVEVPTS
jgi:hypothetical protein